MPHDFLTNYVWLSPCLLLISLWTGLSRAQEAFYWPPISLSLPQDLQFCFEIYFDGLCIVLPDSKAWFNGRKQLTEECTRTDVGAKVGEELHNRDPSSSHWSMTNGHQTTHICYLSVSPGSLTEDLARLPWQCSQGWDPLMSLALSKLTRLLAELSPLLLQDHCGLMPLLAPIFNTCSPGLGRFWETVES